MRSNKKPSTGVVEYEILWNMTVSLFVISFIEYHRTYKLIKKQAAMEFGPNKKNLIILAIITILTACGLGIYFFSKSDSRTDPNSGIADLSNSSLSNSNSGTAETPVTPRKLDENSAEVITTLPFFARVDDNYFRGSQPLRGGTSVLSQLGIKTIIDLRSKYDYTPEVESESGRLGIKYLRVPLSVWNAPPDEKSEEFLKLISNKDDAPFFVFCVDGVNRTGMMTAIYRLSKCKWSLEASIKEMDERGFNPYYYTLRNYVWTYARKTNPNVVPPTGRRLGSFEK
jgi:protein tyrosine phosphatase (PTP) superfamily phosphohydrolase (DUF442 family)